MEFMDCLQGRRSVRKFKPEAIEDGVFEKLITAASCSPSWKNSQTPRYIVVTGEALKNKLADDCVMGFAPNAATIVAAPAVILVTTVANRCGYERDGSFSTSKGTHWESFDAGIATQSLCLAAYEEGLGTVIMGIYDEEAVIKAAGVPDGQKVSAMVAIGVSDEEPAMPKRRGMDELLDYRR